MRQSFQLFLKGPEWCLNCTRVFVFISKFSFTMPRKSAPSAPPSVDLLNKFGHTKRPRLGRNKNEVLIDPPDDQSSNELDAGPRSTKKGEFDVGTKEEDSKQASLKKGRSKVSIKFESDSAKNKLSEPENWQVILENIREMRKDKDAPVDTMGCDMHADPDADPKVQRYHTLVSLMLSPQTKDQVTDAAMKKLKAHGLTIDSVLEMTEETLGELIYPVGFWKTKLKNLKKVAQILRDEYDDDIPDTVEKLCQLPGVGPKIAYLAMNIAWDKVTGIGVDTHVHRISNRLGWVGKKGTKAPEETRVALESWLPQELWSEVNHILVGFGQTICAPMRPKCESCLNKNICPSAFKESKSKKGNV